MIIGHDVNGVAFTDDDIRELSECADRGDFSNLEDASDCVYGAISPISDEKKKISAEKFDEIFDEGEQDILQYADLSQAQRPNQIRNLRISLPDWM